MSSILEIPKARMSWQEFLHAGEEGQRWEFVDGEIEFMSPAGRKHGAVIANLIMGLRTFTRNHRDWVCFASETAFTMASGNWRCPDAALVRAERFPDREIPDEPADFPPDAAFEVYSPGDTASQIARKRKDYQDSGTTQVWIDPKTRMAEVIEPGRPARYFVEGESVVIEKAPGFALDLKALFEV